jgi:hypothetical protein
MHMSVRERPYNLKGRGMGFFLKKYSDSQCCWKKYSDFGGGKKIIWFRVYVIYPNVKFCATKKNKSSNSCVVRSKISERNKKP